MPERPQRDRSSARPAPIHIARRLDTALCDRPGSARCRADTEEAARRRPRPMELAGLEPATSCMPCRQPASLISGCVQGILCLQRLGSRRRFLRNFRPFPTGSGQRPWSLARSFKLAGLGGGQPPLKDSHRLERTFDERRPRRSPSGSESGTIVSRSGSLYSLRSLASNSAPVSTAAVTSAHTGWRSRTRSYEGSPWRRSLSAGTYCVASAGRATK
jgi:hypothetical protein